MIEGEEVILMQRGECVEFRPSLAWRFWRALGFTSHIGEEPTDTDQMQGWQRHELRLHFDLFDRLRLLVSGRLDISYTVHTDTPDPAVIKTRMDWRITPPGSPHER